MLILYIIGALALIYIGLQLVRAPLYDWVVSLAARGFHDRSSHSFCAYSCRL